MNTENGPKKGSLLKKILLGLVVLIVAFVIVVATRPADYLVTRTGKFNAPPSAVFPHVNDLHKFQAWSPWAKIDPNAKFTYEGPSAGTGSAFGWEGNSEVGSGKMTITESRTNELIRFRLDFIKPMSGAADTEFLFKPDGKGSEVTWNMSGKRGFREKAICMVMNMDKMVGGQFEEGLANLKGIVEAPAAK